MKVASGESVGPYELIAPLGAGGMGEVWRARDARLRREVAVKFLAEALSADPGAVSRFEREARAAAALAHPGILAVHDVGTHRGRPYLVSELLRGRSLREALADGPLAVSQAQRLGAEVARALAAAHRAGVVHRDLKPENLFLTADGGVRILDFGLASVASPETPSLATFRTESGAVLGTLGYLAPEQLRGETMGPAADLFGLGCVLHECVTGAPLYRRDSVAATLQAIAAEPPPPLRLAGGGGGGSFESWIARCLDKDPARRPQADELARGLDSAVFTADTVVESRASRLGSPLARRPRRFAAAAAVVAAAALAVAAWLVFGGDSAPVSSEAPMAAAAPAAAPAGRGTASDAAWEAFVRARHAWETRGDGLREALQLYRQAVDLDPTFA
ncbi:MAG: serine/threonine protein kinase, partial [Thermoanaerobaculia bacterium]|nr:serine/threonine protein kinase [Thermoanaerobaculia bacterium]